MATLACQTYRSPFHRHLSFYDRDGDGIIHFGESLKANLSLGLDFPAAFVGSIGIHCYYGNTRPFFLGPFRGISIIRVNDERNMLEGIETSPQSPSAIDRETLIASSGARTLIDRMHVWGLWALAADKHGKVTMSDVRKYQEGTMLYELEKRRRDRSDVLPLSRGGPIIVSGHSWTCALTDSFMAISSKHFAMDMAWSELPITTTHQDYRYKPMVEDLARCSIDWNAPIGELDTTYDDNEPTAPPNRAIYRLQTQSGWKVVVSPPNPDWFVQFLAIKVDLHNLLSSCNPPILYNNIEHIGSTSIPNLCAKPNIDILITFPNLVALEAAVETFDWEIPTSPPYVKYTRVPNGGGIQGRESLKLYVPDHSPYYESTPERSVYLINEDESNTSGRVQIRCYRTVKAVLSDPANTDLLEDYAAVKLDLSTRTFADSITYSALKDDVIRKILKRAGWTDEEVDVKERLSKRWVLHDEPAY